MDKSGAGDSRDGGPSSTPQTASSSSSSSSSSTSQASTVPAIGCGSSSSSGPSAATPMTLNVTTTTGGSFSVLVDGENSVENLKKIISKKLKVSKDRICLLHRERELHDGTLRENGLMDGSKLILTPNVETGLLAQRAENTVMQALESLNDNQVNDFLSGKSPLNLSVRLGDHMMLIQLQLSTLNPSSQSGSRSKTHKSRTLTGGTTSSSGAGTSLVQASSSRSRTTVPIGLRRVTTADGGSASSSRSIVEHVTETQTFTKQELENIHSIVKNLAESENPTMAIVRPSAPEPMETEPETRPSASESPIKSLSNLVSSSINSSNIPPPCNNNNILPTDLPSTCTDPISANLTSCLCKRLVSNDNNSCDPNCLSHAPEPQPSTSTASLHRTSHNPIARHKTKIQTLRKHYSFDSTTLAKTEFETVQPVASTSAPNSPQRPEQSLVHHLHHHHHQHYHPHHHQQHSHQSQPQPGPSNASRALNADPSSIENPALAEASRNLTQTLRKLSKRVFTNKVSEAVAQEQARNVSSGAVIESMKHHGKGIYSGTFSGTLNPALQDKFGRPKRDISTIIHILNDLLSAAPQCARTGTKIYFEPSQSASTATAATSNQVTAGAGASGSSSSGSSGSNLQAAALMAPTTLTTPVATPSPRLMSRCVPASIQTKKYPSNGATNTIASISSSSSNCSGCKAAEPLTSSSSSNGATSSTFARCHYHPKATPKALCKCGHPLTPTASSSSSTISAQQHCQRCAAAISAAELENSKTKSKLDNLRLIMQQKKERREARKQKCAPYSTAASPLAPSSTVGVRGMAAAVTSRRSTATPTFASAATTTTTTATTTTTTADGVETMETTPAITGNSDGAASELAGTSNNNNNISISNSSSNAANSATATATATTTTTAAATAATAAAATSSEAAQSHQIVEEVDTVA